MTYSVKKYNWPHLNLKIGEDLPNETQILPPQNQQELNITPQIAEITSTTS